MSAKKYIFQKNSFKEYLLTLTRKSLLASYSISSSCFFDEKKNEVSIFLQNPNQY